MLLTKSAKGRNRTDDTSIFSAVLYQLSYLGLLTSCERCLALALPLTRHTIAWPLLSVKTLFGRIL